MVLYLRVKRLAICARLLLEKQGKKAPVVLSEVQRQALLRICQTP